MNRERQGFHISLVHSLWQDLSHHSIIFDLVTLTLKFDLFTKNFNLGLNLWTTRVRAVHMSHVYFLWQELSHHSRIFDLETLTLKFDLLFKDFNFEPWETGLSYFTCVFFVTRFFIPYHNFWLNDLDHELTLNVAILILLPLGKLHCLLTTLVLWYKGFRHRTESDLFLFLFADNTITD